MPSYASAPWWQTATLLISSLFGSLVPNPLQYLNLLRRWPTPVCKLTAQRIDELLLPIGQTRIALLAILDHGQVLGGPVSHWQMPVGEHDPAIPARERMSPHDARWSRIDPAAARPAALPAPPRPPLWSFPWAGIRCAHR